jgi:hypothetical protein
MQNLGTPSPDSQKEDADSAHSRSSLWQSVCETWQYLSEARRENASQIRAQDKQSVTFVACAFGLSILLMIVPLISPQLRTTSYSLTLLADVLYTAALLWFVLIRFGILRTMSKRDAWICWQMMVGAAILTVVLGANLSAIILMFCLSSHSPMP